LIYVLHQVYLLLSGSLIITYSWQQREYVDVNLSVNNISCQSLWSKMYTLFNINVLPFWQTKVFCTQSLKIVFDYQANSLEIGKVTKKNKCRIFKVSKKKNHTKTRCGRWMIMKKKGKTLILNKVYILLHKSNTMFKDCVQNTFVCQGLNKMYAMSE
jgi:hypothetical protein